MGGQGQVSRELTGIRSYRYHFFTAYSLASVSVCLALQLLQPGSRAMYLSTEEAFQKPHWNLILRMKDLKTSFWKS